MDRKKLVIAVTGASGAVYAKQTLEKIKQHQKEFSEIGVVFSDHAKSVWEHELRNTDFLNTSFPVWQKNNFSAPFASGSSGYNLMIIIPCSMGTLGRIANGFSDDLITRAADVILKERGRLILVVRDMPFSLIHIRNMEKLTLAGGIICPANPSFYSHPESIEDLADTVVSRVLDLAGIQQKTYRWGGGTKE